MGKTGTWELSDNVLDRAMCLFWDKGYFDTSIEDLVRDTGLNRAAIYGRFGGKQALFEALLNRYRSTVTAELLEPLQSPNSGLGDIEQFFRRVHDYLRRPGGPRGCLMCNTASEVSPHIAEVATIVSAFMADLQGRFRRACSNALERGDIDPATDVVAVADYLCGAVLGLMALARSPSSPQTLTHYVDGILFFLGRLRP